MLARYCIMSLRRLHRRLGAAMSLNPGSSLAFWFLLGTCLITDFYVARNLYPNSDSVQTYNEMLAIRSGNLLLHDWVLATDNFLLTDLPLYVSSSFVFGSGPSLIYIVPFITFVLLLVACLLLLSHVVAVREQRLVGGCIILLLLGMPYGLYYNFFFWSDFHIATLTMCLYAIVAVAPALSGREFRRLRLVPFTMLVFAVAFSDPIADGLLFGPIVLLVLLRTWLDGVLRLDDLLIAGCVILGLVASILAMRWLEGMRAFIILPSLRMNFVPDLRALSTNLAALLGGFRMLFTVGDAQVIPRALREMISSSRLLIAVCVAASSVLVVWRLPRARNDGVTQLLVIGTLCLACLEAMSGTFSLSITGPKFFPGASVRFVVPLFVFASTSAAIELSSILARCPPIRRRLLVTIGMAAGISYCCGGVWSVAGLATQAPAIQTAPQRRLADWLESNGLLYGIGDYWDTQMVHALSGGAVTADPVTQVDGHASLFIWLTDAAQGRSGRRPQFAIITPGSVFRVTMPAVQATYGRPLSVTEVAGHYFVARFKP